MKINALISVEKVKNFAIQRVASTPSNNFVMVLVCVIGINKHFHITTSMIYLLQPTVSMRMMKRTVMPSIIEPTT